MLSSNFIIKEDIKIKSFKDIFRSKPTLFVLELGNITQANVTQFYKDVSYIKDKFTTGDVTLLRINCQGGSPALSEELMHFLMHQEQELDIVCYIETVCIWRVLYSIRSITYL